MNEIFNLFLRLGAVGFGGPIALIGYMEDECVKKRAWISDEQFHRFVAVAKLFPGPLASLIAIRIGHQKNKKWGGIVAGVALILPAFVMIVALGGASSVLDRFTSLQHLWLGLSLAAVAVALNATVNLTKPLFKSTILSHVELAAVLTFAAVMTFFYPGLEVAFLILSGIVGLLIKEYGHLIRPRETGSIILFTIFISCFRASIFTFGSGIAIVPVLRTIFIDHLHYVSNQDFLRGLTLGQITPGPLVIVSTYLGFVKAGVLGATIATLGTFSPTFILGTLVMPRVETFLLRSQKLKVFFEWMVAAVCGAIFASLAKLLLLSVVVNQNWIWQRGALAILLFLLMIRFKLSPGKVFILGGILAYFM